MRYRMKGRMRTRLLFALFIIEQPPSVPSVQPRNDRISSVSVGASDNDNGFPMFSRVSVMDLNGLRKASQSCYLVK